MTRTSSRLTAPISLALLALMGPAPAALAGSSMLACEALPVLVDRLHDVHLEYKKPSAALDARVVELYVDALDPARSLLLEAQAEDVARRVAKATKEVRKGRCGELDALQQERASWYLAMETFVRKTTSAPGLEVDRTIELEVDPDDRPRPTTVAEQQELWRELVHVQLAGYLARDMSLEEASRRLVHRYELLSRRVGEVDSAEVYGNFLDATARALDPHSTYFSADALEDFRISMELSLEGIGAVLTQDDGYTVVREVVAGGAASRQGTLKSGDRIVAVAQGPYEESVDVVDTGLRDVVRLIRGKKGTPVTLSVQRDGKSMESLTITIVRDAIDLEEQAASLRIEERELDGRSIRLAVIDLPGFYGGSDGPKARNADDDVRRLLQQARDEKADGVLLDLSQNGGGLLSHAVTISGLFLGTGPVVGVAGTGAGETHSDEDPSVVWSGPLAVLTSRGSASASEILAGALKDHGRAVLVGDAHTFGKGSVQSVVGLPQGFGALKVTIAKFYRPSGESTQNTGVPVDVVVRSPLDRPEVGEASLQYPLPTSRIAPMTGGEPNPTGVGHWTPITQDVVDRLRMASAKRIIEDDDFKTLDEALAEATSAKPMVRISEILSSEDKPQAATGIRADDDDDGASPATGAPAPPTPQAREALNVLADLVRLQSSGS